VRLRQSWAGGGRRCTTTGRTCFHSGSDGAVVAEVLLPRLVRLQILLAVVVVKLLVVVVTTGVVVVGSGEAE
jgi:hypothetical protein